MLLVPAPHGSLWVVRKILRAVVANITKADETRSHELMNLLAPD